jgi:hypothetical protein
MEASRHPAAHPRRPDIAKEGLTCVTCSHSPPSSPMLVSGALVASMVAAVHETFLPTGEFRFAFTLYL